jgi:hypothetical protein
VADAIGAVRSPAPQDCYRLPTFDSVQWPIHDGSPFSLVSCPVYLLPATVRTKPIRLHQVWRAGPVEENAADEKRLRLDMAPALVVTLDDRAAANELVAGARAERADLLIVVRARDAAHAARLYRTGASDAVPETIEASLQLSEAVLVDVGVPMGRVIASIHDKRAALQATLKAMAPDAEVRTLGRRRLRDRL